MIYESIKELPLKVFDQIQQTSDLRYLIAGFVLKKKEPANALPEGITHEEILQSWENIQREFYDSFGIKENEKRLMEVKVRYLNHLYQYHLAGDKFSKTLAKLEEQRLQMMTVAPTSKKSVSLMKVCVSLSKTLEFRVDYNSINTAEFFYYIELSEEISKSYKSINNKK